MKYQGIHYKTRFWELYLHDNASIYRVPLHEAQTTNVLKLSLNFILFVSTSHCTQTIYQTRNPTELQSPKEMLYWWGSADTDTLLIQVANLVDGLVEDDFTT